MTERIAVITGGSSGIGADVARRLAAGGWHVVLVARGEERLRAFADELGGDVETEICDVGDRAGVQALAARITARHPKIDLLVNNAGVPGKADFFTDEVERIENVMRINYFGGIWCLRAFLPALEAAAPSDVVNVVSVAGTVALPASGPYAASKHAQLAFSRAVAAQLRPRGVRVHTVLPGFSPTAGFPEPAVLPKTLAWTTIPSDRIARAIVRAVRHDRRESTVPWWFRSVAILQGSTPNLFARGLPWFTGRFGRTARAAKAGRKNHPG